MIIWVSIQTEKLVLVFISAIICQTAVFQIFITAHHKQTVLCLFIHAPNSPIVVRIQIQRHLLLMLLVDMFMVSKVARCYKIAVVGHVQQFPILYMDSIRVPI
jgi:hypothetical protein